MVLVRARPTIDVPTSMDSHEAIESIRRAVDTESDSFAGQFKGRHAMLSMVPSKRHFWSPWLHLEVIDTTNHSASNKCAAAAVGRFSPHPSLWTAFAFSWLTLGVLSFFSLIVGLAQNLLGDLPWGYGLLAVWLVIAGLLWLAAIVGQKLAWSEMHRMSDLVKDCLRTKENQAPNADQV